MITNECIHKKLVIALNHDNYVRNERDGFKSELSMPVGRSKGPKWSQWIHTYSWG